MQFITDLEEKKEEDKSDESDKEGLDKKKTELEKL